MLHDIWNKWGISFLDDLAKNDICMPLTPEDIFRSALCSQITFRKKGIHITLHNMNEMYYIKESNSKEK